LRIDCGLPIADYRKPPRAVLIDATTMRRSLLGFVQQRVDRVLCDETTFDEHLQPLK
jgi:hypothetical protein